jgi:hypothetical protein
MASIHTSNFGIIQSHLDGAPLKVKLVIHNQCPGIELVSPVYGGDSITCYISPDQRVDAGSKMQVGFSIHPAREESIGIFMHKLQKKKTDQSNEDIMSSGNNMYSTCFCLEGLQIRKISYIFGSNRT